jgi:hypothetical protein
MTPQVVKETGGVRIVNTRKRYLGDTRIPVEAGQEMPSASDASRVRKVDRCLTSDVVHAGNAFEIKIEKRLGHGSFFSLASPCLI